MSFQVDLSQIKKKGNRYLWKQSINSIVKFKNNDTWEYFQIISIIDKKCLKLEVQYKNKFIEILATSIKKGQLNSLFKQKTSEFKLKIGQTISNKKQSLVILHKERRLSSKGQLRKQYEFECCDCHRKSWKEESALLKGIGCPYCNNSGIKEIGFNDIPTKAPWMIPYFQGGIEEARQYTPAQNKKIQFKCPYCGRLAKNLKTINFLYYTHSIGCICCKHMSLPETIMYNILTQSNINFITQLSCSTFNWIGRYRYDFYLPDYNCIIETHGCQHYKQTKLIGRSLDEEQKNDVKKKNTALKNGIQNYYEIDCRESTVKFIIDSCEKANLLQFLNINKNDIKFDDLYYNKFHDLIIKVKNEISKTPNISFSKILNKLNISRYDLTRILDILQIKLADNKLPIKIIKDNNLIAEYVSYQEFLRQAKGKDFYSTINTIKKYIKQGMLFKNKYKFILNNYVNNLDSTDKKF